MRILLLLPFAMPWIASSVVLAQRSEHAVSAASTASAMTPETEAARARATARDTVTTRDTAAALDTATPGNNAPPGSTASISAAEFLSEVAPISAVEVAPLSEVARPGATFSEVTLSEVMLSDATLSGAAEPNFVEAYRLGPNDTVVVQVLDIEEIGDKPVRIDGRGNLSLPLLGRVPAAGRTAEQLENELAARLGRFLVEPQVTVTLAEVSSQPVSILGAVNKPGVHQIDSPKTIVEMLSLAGGLREDAGHTIKITRRANQGPIPLPGAHADSSGGFSVAEINVKEILEARRPEDNIVIEAHDVISVPRAEMVYVIGEVEKSGGFVLEERESVSVLQALSLAGGLTNLAGMEQARILRGGGVGSGGSGAGERVEIAVDLKAVMAGKSADVALEREDILFVPRSGKRAAGQAVKRAALGTLSGIAIWRIGSR